MTNKPNDVPHECRECGSTELIWFTSYRNTSGVAEGRLRTNEVSCSFVLGCEGCSETLAVVGADDFPAYITELLAQPADQQGKPVAWTYMHKGREPCSESLPCLVWASESVNVMRQGLKTGDHVHYHPRPDLYDWRPLYRHAQPATAKVVLPERKPEPSGMTEIDDDREAAIWNACLDEVAKLNNIGDKP